MMLKLTKSQESFLKEVTFQLILECLENFYFYASECWFKNTSLWQLGTSQCCLALKVFASVFFPSSRVTALHKHKPRFKIRFWQVLFTEHVVRRGTLGLCCMEVLLPALYPASVVAQQGDCPSWQATAGHLYSVSCIVIYNRVNTEN